METTTGMGEPVTTEESEATERARLKGLAITALGAMAELGPQIVLNLVNALDRTVIERDKTNALLDAISMAARNLMAAVKKRGVGGDKKHESEDHKLYHEVDVALNNIDAVRRWEKRD